MPLLFVAVLAAWTTAYGARQKKKGERMAAMATVSEVGSLAAARDASPLITTTSLGFES